MAGRSQLLARTMMEDSQSTCHATPAQTAWMRMRLLYEKKPFSVAEGAVSDAVAPEGVAPPGAAEVACGVPAPEPLATAPEFVFVLTLPVVALCGDVVVAALLAEPPLMGTTGGSIGAVFSVNAAERSR